MEKKTANIYCKKSARVKSGSCGVTRCDEGILLLPGLADKILLSVVVTPSKLFPISKRFYSCLERVWFTFPRTVPIRYYSVSLIGLQKKGTLLYRKNRSLNLFAPSFIIQYLPNSGLLSPYNEEAAFDKVHIFFTVRTPFSYVLSACFVSYVYSTGYFMRFFLTLRLVQHNQLTVWCLNVKNDRLTLPEFQRGQFCLPAKVSKYVTEARCLMLIGRYFLIEEEQGNTFCFCY